MKRFSKRLLSLLLSGLIAAAAFAAVPAEVSAEEEKIPYAEVITLDETELDVDKDVMLVFKYGVSPDEYDEEYNWWKINSFDDQYGWDYSTYRYKKVIFDPTLNDENVVITSCSKWFSNFEDLEEIEGWENLNTSYVTDMSSMFENCSSLTSIAGLSNFNTEHVSNMSKMFAGCSSLTGTLDLSSFNTAKVTDMSEMFSGCSDLTEIKLTSFTLNTQKKVNTSKMFFGCSNLTALDLTSFDGTRISDATSMFENCSKLASIKVSSDRVSWNLSAQDSADMFSGCTALIGSSAVVDGTMAKVADGYFSSDNITILPKEKDIKPTGVYMSLDGTIRMNFMVENLDYVEKVLFSVVYNKGDTYVDGQKVDGTTRNDIYVDVDNTIRTTGILECPLNPAQIYNGIIYMTAFGAKNSSGNDVYGETRAVSISSNNGYLTRAIGQQYTDEQKTKLSDEGVFLQALVTYGAAALNYNAGSEVSYVGVMENGDNLKKWNSYLEKKDTELIQFSTYESDKSGDTIASGELILKDAVNLKLYYNNVTEAKALNNNNTACYKDDQKTSKYDLEFGVETVNGTIYRYVTIKNIPAHGLKHILTINFKDSDGNDGYISVSPMNYLKEIEMGSNNRHEINLARALYDYCTAAEVVNRSSDEGGV